MSDQRKMKESADAGDLLLRWHETEHQTERLKHEMISGKMSPQKARTVCAAIVGLYKTQLSLRAQAEDIILTIPDYDPDYEFASKSRILIALIEFFFTPRFDLTGTCRKSVAEAYSDLVGIPLDRETVFLLVAAFCELYFQHSRNKEALFPLNEWLCFRSLYAGDLSACMEDVDHICSIYDRHLAFGRDCSSHEEITSALKKLVTIDWENHRGFQTAKYLLQMAHGHKTDTDERSLPEEVRNHLYKFKIRLKKRMKLFTVTRVFSGFCTEQGCPQRFVVQAEIRNQLTALEPAVCPECGIAIIPEQIREILEKTYRKQYPGIFRF